MKVYVDNMACAVWFKSVLSPTFKFILWKPPKIRLFVTLKTMVTQWLFWAEEFRDVIIKRQTYSAVLHISSVSLFRGRGMPVLNKNQIINIKQIKC